MTARFREGDTVRLRADPSEGWPEEEAVVLVVEDPKFGTGEDQVYVVEVAVYGDSTDDGLREVTQDQMEGL